MTHPFAGRGLDLIYIVKVWLAAIATYFFALWLEMPQPQTAVISVFILMQPQSGPVIAKSLYRVLGTLLGAGMAVLLMALCGQQGTLCVVALALWVGLCCALATRYRGFTAYACVLAGYTAVIVGAPALANPTGVFISALWRVMEIGLAIGCSALISAVLLPQHSARALEAALHRRLGHLSGVIADALEGATSAVGAPVQRQLAGEAVAWDNLRQLAAFEDPRWSTRQTWLLRLNGELMAAATTFNALLQWLPQLSAQEHEALQPHLDALIDRLRARQAQPMTAGHPQALAEHLEQLLDALTQAARANRQTLATAQRLLADLLAGLRHAALTHAALERNLPAPPTAPFETFTSGWLSLAAGLRATVLVAALAGVWYLSAWPSGTALLLTAAAGVSLASTTPNPRGTGAQMFQGAVIGSVLAFIDYCYVYPALDGFPLIALAMAPPILYGAWLTTRLPTMGIGLGMLVTFSSVAIPANVPLYDPVGVIDACLATMLSFGAAAVAGAVVMPSNAPWSWRRLAQALRAQVSFAAAAPLPHLRQRLESRTRDLLHHATALSVGAPQVQGELLATALQTQMIGVAIIEIRQALGESPVARRLAPLLAAWAEGERPALDASLATLDGREPDEARARDYLAWLAGMPPTAHAA